MKAFVRGFNYYEYYPRRAGASTIGRAAAFGAFVRDQVVMTGAYLGAIARIGQLHGGAGVCDGVFVAHVCPFIGGASKYGRRFAVYVALFVVLAVAGVALTYWGLGACAPPP